MIRIRRQFSFDRETDFHNAITDFEEPHSSICDRLGALGTRLVQGF